MAYPHLIAAGTDLQLYTASMPSTSLHLLFAVACCQACAGAYTDIVLFGDSLSDDCTHGASQVVDEALSTDQVMSPPTVHVSTESKTSALICSMHVKVAALIMC